LISPICTHIRILWLGSRLCAIPCFILLIQRTYKTCELLGIVYLTHDCGLCIFSIKCPVPASSKIFWILYLEHVIIASFAIEDSTYSYPSSKRACLAGKIWLHLLFSLFLQSAWSFGRRWILSLENAWLAFPDPHSGSGTPKVRVRTFHLKILG
jgi:hypothetical protein